MAETTDNPRLKTHYDEVVRKAKLIEEFGYKNAMHGAAQLDKIVLNMGVARP
jgi:large subunit ribosomal protein L5